MCDSVDCPVLYSKVRAERDVEDLIGVSDIVARLAGEGA